MATSAAFFILGAVFATWASRIPAIRDLAVLTPITLGYILLAKGIGTVVIMPAVTATIHKVGAKKGALMFGALLILLLSFMVVAPGWKSLAIVLLFTGAAISGYNITINALGAKIEANTGRSHMSTLHSWFGVGNLSGAILGTYIASTSMPVEYHFWGVSILLFGFLFFIYQYLPDDEPDPSIASTSLRLPHGGLIWLGLICFLAASIESSISNWVALFFTDYIGSTATYASIGYAVYAGSMLAVRLVGDRLKPRYGAQKLLSVGSAISACGIMLAIYSPNMIWAIMGFVAAGGGVALTYPMVFSAAGKEGAVALASVATMGFVGGMISQPLMGYLVNLIGLDGGFMFIALCMVIITGSSWRARLLTK